MNQALMIHWLTELSLILKKSNENREYVVVDKNRDLSKTYSGKELAEGIGLHLVGGEEYSTKVE